VLSISIDCFLYDVDDSSNGQRRWTKPTNNVHLQFWSFRNLRSESSFRSLISLQTMMLSATARFDPDSNRDRLKSVKRTGWCLRMRSETVSSKTISMGIYSGYPGYPGYPCVAEGEAVSGLYWEQVGGNEEVLW
jgi:hypothetical protein